MNAGKTHLIASLQPQRLEVVAAQINRNVMNRRRGMLENRFMVQPSPAALGELMQLLDAYEAALQRHAAAVVWGEEYVGEVV